MDRLDRLDRTNRISIIWHAGWVPQYQDRYLAFAQHAGEVYVLVPDERQVPPLLEPAPGITIRRVPVRFAMHNQTRRARDLHRILDEQSPDLLYVHEEPHSMLAAQAARWVERSPVARHRATRMVIDSALINMKLWLRGHNPAEQRVYRVAHRVLYRNEECRTVLLRRGCPAEKLAGPVGNGVATRLFRPVPELREQPRPFTVGFAGRVARAKGVDMLQTWAARNPDQRLIIAGPVEDRDLVENLSSTSNSSYAGVLSPGELNVFYNSIDLLVLPSRRTAGWSEQFGRVLIEALAAGTRAIGSRVGAIPELLGDDHVFEEGNQEALNALIARIRSETPTDYAAAIQRQREPVIARYSWDALTRRALELSQ